MISKMDVKTNLRLYYYNKKVWTDVNSENGEVKPSFSLSVKNIYFTQAIQVPFDLSRAKTI